MELTTLTRRDVLKVASGIAAAGVINSSMRAEAQQVKYSMGTEPPKLKAPPNATDCHHHIYDARYPVDPTATLRPADALVEDYRALQKRIGTTRNVLGSITAVTSKRWPRSDRPLEWSPLSMTAYQLRSSGACTRSACAASVSI